MARDKNAAPNYVPYTSLRVPFRLDTQTSAALGRVVSHAQVSIYQRKNNAPYVNGQTIWGLTRHPVRNPQGFKR